METTLEPTAAVENLTSRQPYDKDDAPRPEWTRGICPQCGSPIVSNCYYMGSP